jgi:hypothetical protein
VSFKVEDVNVAENLWKIWRYIFASKNLADQTCSPFVLRGNSRSVFSVPIWRQTQRLLGEVNLSVVSHCVKCENFPKF